MLSGLRQRYWLVAIFKVNVAKCWSQVPALQDKTEIQSSWLRYISYLFSTLYSDSIFCGSLLTLHPRLPKLGSSRPISTGIVNMVAFRIINNLFP
jgi:hypothetical protein